MMRLKTAFAGRRPEWRLVLVAIVLGASLPLGAQVPQPAIKPVEATATSAPEVKEEKKADKPQGAVTAVFARRAITVSGEPIEDAVVLVADGKIFAIGPRSEVEVPSFARRVDAGDQVIMPGWIHASSLAYSGGGRFRFSGSSSSANREVKRRLDPSFAESERIAKAGFTTLAVGASGGGFVGTGVLVKPVAKKKRKGLLPIAEVIREEDSLLSAGFTPSTQTKKLFRETLEKARKYIKDLEAWEKAQKEAEKKKAAAAKKSTSKTKKAASTPAAKSKTPAKKTPEKKTPAKKTPAKKVDPKKGSAKAAKAKPQGPKKPREDPRILPVVKLVKGEIPVICGVPSAAAILHLHHLIKDWKDFRPALLMGAASGGFSMFGRGSSSTLDPWRVVKEIKELGVAVILPPVIGTKPNTRTIRVAQRILLDGGIPLVLVPEREDATGYASFRYRLLQLIRHGVSEKQVLRAITLSPAEVLGIQERFGSLEKGKVADLLFFSGDPFAPTSELRRVMVSGETVYEKKEGGS